MENNEESRVKILEQFQRAINDLIQGNELFVDDNDEPISRIKIFSSSFKESGVDFEDVVGDMIKIIKGLNNFNELTDPQFSRLVDFYCNLTIDLSSTPNNNRLLGMLSEALDMGDIPSAEKAVSGIEDSELELLINSINNPDAKNQTKKEKAVLLQEVRSIIYALAKDSIEAEKVREIFSTTAPLGEKMKSFAKIANKITADKHFRENGTFIGGASAGKQDCVYITKFYTSKSIQATVDESGEVESHSLLRHPISAYAITPLIDRETKSFSRGRAKDFISNILASDISLDYIKSAFTIEDIQQYIRNSSEDIKEYKKLKKQNKINLGKSRDDVDESFNKLMSYQVLSGKKSYEKILVDLIKAKEDAIKKKAKVFNKDDKFRFPVVSILSFLAKKDNTYIALHLSDQILNNFNEDNYSGENLDLNLKDREYNIADNIGLLSEIDTMFYYHTTPSQGDGINTIDVDDKDKEDNPEFDLNQVEFDYLTSPLIHFINTKNDTVLSKNISLIGSDGKKVNMSEMLFKFYQDTSLTGINSTATLSNLKDAGVEDERAKKMLKDYVPDNGKFASSVGTPKKAEEIYSGIDRNKINKIRDNYEKYIWKILVNQDGSRSDFEAYESENSESFDTLRTFFTFFIAKHLENEDKLKTYIDWINPDSNILQRPQKGGESNAEYIASVVMAISSRYKGSKSNQLMSGIVSKMEVKVRDESLFEKDEVIDEQKKAINEKDKAINDIKIAGLISLYKYEPDSISKAIDAKEFTIKQLTSYMKDNNTPNAKEILDSLEKDTPKEPVIEAKIDNDEDLRKSILEDLENPKKRKDEDGKDDAYYIPLCLSPTKNASHPMISFEEYLGELISNPDINTTGKTTEELAKLILEQLVVLSKKDEDMIDERKVIAICGYLKVDPETIGLSTTKPVQTDNPPSRGQENNIGGGMKM